MRKSLVNLVPFVLTYLIYDAAEKEHNRLDRKMPGQYDHEEYNMDLCLRSSLVDLVKTKYIQCKQKIQNT